MNKPPKSNNQQGEPTAKKARRADDELEAPVEDAFDFFYVARERKCCEDVKPPPLVLDLDPDLGRKVQFDTGPSVVIERKIAEGGFGSIFVATMSADGESSKKRKYDDERQEKYAVKRIECVDARGNLQESTIQRCRNEAAVHNASKCENLMPILGTRDPVREGPQSSSFYMVFPFISLSLEEDISQRRLLEDTEEINRNPYTKMEVLGLFSGISNAVRTMHANGYSHRDLKPSNVLIKMKVDGNFVPVLTDFGSAGPVVQPLKSRNDVSNLCAEISKHTSLEFLAAELCFPENLSFGPTELLDFGRADVWSLGCLFFAILYGASPFEMCWGVSFVGNPADATVRIVRASREAILGPIPFPVADTASERRYGNIFNELIRCMLNKDRMERLSSSNVAGRIQQMLRSSIVGDN